MPDRHSMRPLSVVDVFVFFGIIIWSICFELSILELLSFILDVLLHLPAILLDIGLHQLGLRKDEEVHFRKISNALQQLIIQLVAYAFDKVHYRVGRLFFSSQNCLRFLRWRYRGSQLPFTTLTIVGLKAHKDVLTYVFDGGKAGKEAKQVILYIHGGGLIVGSVPFYVEFLALLATQCQDTVIFSPEYDLVPEACYPTQLDQITAVLIHITREFPNARVILGGDSAGAGLCQSLLQRLASSGSLQPKDTIDKCFYISPWLDFESRFARTKGHGDYISPEAVLRYGKWYMRDTVLTAEDSMIEASPLTCTTRQIRDSVPASGMLIQSGGSECLLSDSGRFVSKIQEVPSFNLKWVVEPHEIHAFVLTNLYLRRGEKRFHGLKTILKFLSTTET